jgi:hypothetical protein
MDLHLNSTHTSSLAPDLTPGKPEAHSTSLYQNLALKSNNDRIAQETELVTKNIQNIARFDPKTIFLQGKTQKKTFFLKQKLIFFIGNIVS